MTTTVELSEEGFSEEEYADVGLCLRTMMNIMQGTQPLARGLGIDGDILDDPVSLAANRLTLDISEKVSAYEPRAMAESVTVAQGADGELQVTTYFERDESYESE